MIEVLATSRPKKRWMDFVKDGMSKKRVNAEMTNG